MSPAERSDPPERCHPAECCHPENIRQGCSQDLPVRTCPILQVEILRLLVRAGIISPALANCALDGLERPAGKVPSRKTSQGPQDDSTSVLLLPAALNSLSYAV